MTRPLIPVLAAAAGLALAASAHAQPAAQDYVARAGASDTFEMAEARLAERRAHSPRVKAFARMMVRDHTKSTHMVVAAATRSMGHAPPPPEMDGHQRDDLRDLTSAAPRDFDRVYVTQQTNAHREALELHRNYAQGGDDPGLKAVAAKITPVVQRHLDMASELADHMK